MSRLKLSGLSKRYGDFLAVDGIDLELQSGEFVSLLGAMLLTEHNLFYLLDLTARARIAMTCAASRPTRWQRPPPQAGARKATGACG